jgi:hypothetical protein
MKKYTFKNGETRFESQMGGRDFETACLLWGCFDNLTGQPLPHTTTIASEKDVKDEAIRLAQIESEYQEVKDRNEKVAIGNARLASATTLNEFLNAYA